MDLSSSVVIAVVIVVAMTTMTTDDDQSQQMSMINHENKIFGPERWISVQRCIYQGENDSLNKTRSGKWSFMFNEFRNSQNQFICQSVSWGVSRIILRRVRTLMSGFEPQRILAPLPPFQNRFWKSNDETCETVSVQTFTKLCEHCFFY